MTGDLFFCVEVFCQILRQLVHPVGIAEDLPALIREFHGVAGALKQADSQLTFQLLDLKGDGGLRKAQLLCRPGEAGQFRHGDEGFQIPKVHNDAPA